MLSRPPASLAAAISSRPTCSSDSARPEDLLDAVVRHHRGQAVGVEHEHVAGLGLVDVDVDLDVGLGAERARDDGPLGMHLGLLLRELAAQHQLADQRVVVREPDQVAAAQQVGARVADVRDRHLALADVRRGQRGPHAGRPRVGPRAVVDRAIGALDDLHQRLGRRRRRASRRRTSRRPSWRRPRRPARRPCRRRPRTGATARRGCPRCPGAGGPGPSAPNVQKFVTGFALR